MGCNQLEMLSAIHSYAKHLHKADAISKKIKELNNNKSRNQVLLKRLGL